MSAVAAHTSAIHRLELATRERRSHDRYPLRLEVGYALLNGGLVERIGYGRTLNVSSSGILFEADHELPIGRSIKLAVEWPILLEGVCGLRLHVRGTIVRSDTEKAAVKIVDHTFRTVAIRIPGANSAERQGELGFFLP